MRLFANGLAKQKLPQKVCRSRWLSMHSMSNHLEKVLAVTKPLERGYPV